jgi:hypothetical protein
MILWTGEGGPPHGRNAIARMACGHPFSATGPSVIGTTATSSAMRPRTGSRTSTPSESTPTLAGSWPLDWVRLTSGGAPPVSVNSTLTGAEPADLPVEQRMRFERVITLETGKALALASAPAAFFQADEVIRCAATPDAPLTRRMVQRPAFKLMETIR